MRFSTQPIHEQEASEDIARIYQSIKNTLGLAYVPMMFKYLAHYQPFLENLWDSINKNIQDTSFKTVLGNIDGDIRNAGHTLFRASSSHDTLITLLPDHVIRQRISEEIRDFFVLQCKLAYVCVAIRQAIKGWAVGAKYLESEQAFHAMNESHASGLDDEIRNIMLVESTSALAVSSDLQNPLLTFLVLLNEEFANVTRTETYVLARVQVEKALDTRVQDMPHPIRASYNDVATLVKNHDELPYLFYLLSEKFPVVHAVSSLMWGYGMGMLGDRGIEG